MLAQTSCPPPPMFVPPGSTVQRSTILLRTTGLHFPYEAPVVESIAGCASVPLAMVKDFTCACGRRYACKNAECARVTKFKCEKQHFKPPSLDLEGGPIAVANILWVVLSNLSNKHHARTLRAQLIDAGAVADTILVKHGFEFGHKDGHRQLGHTEICMYSFRYRWLPRVQQALQQFSHIRCVVYLECTARLAFSSVQEICPTVNGDCAADIFWLGYRKSHRPSEFRNGHSKFVYEGSKMIAFRKQSLRLVYEHLLSTKRYCHLDLWLCRILDPASFFVPLVSWTTSAAHSSVCGGSRDGPIKRPREDAGTKQSRCAFCFLAVCAWTGALRSSPCVQYLSAAFALLACLLACRLCVGP